MAKGTSSGKRHVGGAVTLENVSIAPSSISGKGVFAEHAIQKGRVVGPILRKTNHTGNDDLDYERTNLGHYVNHSNIPNLRVQKSNDEIDAFGQNPNSSAKPNAYVLRSLRTIKKGEELTIDYANAQRTTNIKYQKFDKNITFPKSEYQLYKKELSTPGETSTLRILKELGKYQVGQVYQTPWQQFVRITRKELFQNIDDVFKKYPQYKKTLSTKEMRQQLRDLKRYGKTGVERVYFEPTTVTLQNKSRTPTQLETYNLDKFESGQNKLLYVTGYSGSGKTTIAKKLAKQYGVQHLEVDQIGRKVIADFRKKYTTVQDKPGFTIFEQAVDKLIDPAIKREYTKQTRLRSVIDGLQTEIMGLNDKNISKKSVVFTKAGLLKSSYQAFKREKARSYHKKLPVLDLVDIHMRNNLSMRPEIEGIRREFKKAQIQPQSITLSNQSQNIPLKRSQLPQIPISSRSLRSDQIQRSQSNRALYRDFVYREQKHALENIRNKLGVSIGKIPVKIMENPAVFPSGKLVKPTTEKMREIYNWSQGSSVSTPLKGKPYITLGTEKRFKQTMGFENQKNKPVKSWVRQVLQHENLHLVWEGLTSKQRSQLTRIIRNEKLITRYGKNNRREEQVVDAITELIHPNQYNTLQLDRRTRNEVLRKVRTIIKS